jgi:tetratricopeptide (TPR) repeat protein
VYGGQEGIVEPGKRIIIQPIIKAEKLVQWWLYYPGVLDVEELAFTDSEKNDRSASLANYKSGDLLRALETYPGYPSPAEPATDAAKIYYAALVLSVGQVQKANLLLSTVDAKSSLAAALQLVIASVTGSTNNPPVAPTSASEWLALSYFRQAQYDLPGALQAANRAVGLSTNFAFAWVRVAELEFGFGEIQKARSGLEHAVKLSPRNAQAQALRGFILSAENNISAALAAFEEAIQLDGALANGWLGRGLCRIRKGDIKAGQADLRTAAGLEANRAALRSYLGKSFADGDDLERAAQELKRAQELDPRDPTALLYSALMNHQHNKINQAVQDLEMSQTLNENRRIYRSKLLLDLDRAVQGANLASIYQDVGMLDFSVWEATKAVSSDYANHSAHLFLANSYDALRDPRRITLRYEKPWLNELLVANLLAPVGAGSLSQYISQQEYSKLFESDGLGIASSTTYLSNGDWEQTASQFGTFGNSSYSLDATYQRQNGYRPNEDLTQKEFYVKMKQQLSAQDSLFFQSTLYDYDVGDVFQRYDQSSFSPGRRASEVQAPILLAGYHREWTAGIHTLLLAGRLASSQKITEPNQPSFILLKQSGQVTNIQSIKINSDYENDFEIYITELQQIWQHPPFSSVVGVAYQTGSLQTHNLLKVATSDLVFFADESRLDNIDSNFQRLSIYGYENWQPNDKVLLSAGVSYDWQHYPVNFRFPPISPEHQTRDQLSPKVGFTWMPLRKTTLRGSYTRSLGGVTVDESYRLEPTEIAGFNQAFRDLIPELSTGPVTSPSYETWGIGIDREFKTRTYVGAVAELLNAHVQQANGAFDFNYPEKISSTSNIHRDLSFHEKDLLLTVTQLLNDEWAMGARFKLSQADLDAPVNELPGTGTPSSATLNELNLYILFNHSSGFFARSTATWYSQSNRGYLARPGDDFWQFNFFVGYRYPRRRAEIQLALLNATGQDYQLNPLNLYAELPRERTLAVSLKFNF